jgi:hypothetical protein
VRCWGGLVNAVILVTMFHLDENGVRRRRTKWSIALDDTQLDKLGEAMFFGPLVVALGKVTVL